MTLSRSLVPFVAALFGVAPLLNGASQAATTPTQKCIVAKLKAASKRTTAKLACHTKAVTKGVAVSSDCLEKADLAFLAAFAKAEKKVACSGIASELELESDSCVDAVINTVPTPTATVTPIVPTATATQNIGATPAPTSTPNPGDAPFGAKCNGDADCASNICRPIGKKPANGGNNKRCVQPCTTNDDCPAGASCQGVSPRLCIPG